MFFFKFYNLKFVKFWWTLRICLVREKNNAEIFSWWILEVRCQLKNSVKDKKYKETGWPDGTEPFNCSPTSNPNYPAYSTSKLFINCITRVFAYVFVNRLVCKLCFSRKAESEGRGVLINCCCPGFVKTDMCNFTPSATKVPVEGCKSSLWLAMLPENAQGPQGAIILDA